MPPEDKQQFFGPQQNDVQTSTAQKEAEYQAPLNSIWVPSQNDPSFGEKKHVISFSEESESKVVQAALDSLETAVDSFDAALDSLDEFYATPMANANAIGGDFNFKFYDAIDASNDVVLRYSFLTGAGVFALSIGAYVAAYRKLRNLEKTSHFFYFKRLLESKKSNEILELMGESKFDYAVLSAAAHFYSPDISKFVAWKRRIFCSGDKRKELKHLQSLWLKEGINRQEALKEIFLETIEKVVKVLNEKNTDSDGLKFEHKTGYAIELTENYREKIFSETKEAWTEIEIRKNPSLGNAVLGAIGGSSFIYWLAVFVFCFIPVGIVGGVAVPPLVIAGGFLLFKLCRIAYQFLKKSTAENDNVQSDENQRKEILARKIVELNKRKTFISMESIPAVRFKGSQLHKELLSTLNTRRFSKVHGALQGFVEGCFLPFFVIWVLSDLAKVLTAITIGVSVMGPGMPIAIGIAVVTLVLGVGYGIYSATKAVSAQEARYEKLMEKIACLEKANIQVPDLSLQAYDRLLRRYSLEEPLWTRVKKVLNRGWVILKRLGTGSLTFRLVIWGTVTACTVVPAALIAPISIPFIIGFAVIFAACYYRAYNVNSQLKQAENIVDLHYTGLIAEMDRLSVSARENAAQMRVVNTPPVKNVNPAHFDNKVSPAPQNTAGLVEVSASEVAKSAASPAAQREKLASESKKVASGSVAKVGFFGSAKRQEEDITIIVGAKEWKAACHRIR